MYQLVTLYHIMLHRSTAFPDFSNGRQEGDVEGAVLGRRLLPELSSAKGPPRNRALQSSGAFLPLELDNHPLGGNFARGSTESATHSETAQGVGPGWRRSRDDCGRSSWSSATGRRARCW